MRREIGNRRKEGEKEKTKERRGQPQVKEREEESKNHQGLIHFYTLVMPNIIFSTASFLCRPIT